MKRLIGPALLVLLFLSGAPAQTPRGVGVRVVNERGQAESVKLYDGSYALVIGAADYKYWPKLSGVRDDVPAVRAILQRHGFKVEELLNPTGEELLSRINKFVNDYGLYADNRLLIYFSGHGYTEVSGDGRKFGYVVPVDAPKPSKDLIGFQQKALTMDEIETAARRIRSKHALFVFDSCFSGTLVSKGDVRVPPIIDYYATRPVRQFITAGADNQEVPDESVFRQVFVRGLEGEADFNKDGYVTGTELATYLQERVTYYRAGAQTPQYGKIRDPRLDSGDFVFTIPDSPPAPNKTDEARELAARAMAKLMRGDFGEAVRLANQSLSLDDSVALAYAVRGRSSAKLDEDETGLADLGTANRLDRGSGLLRALLSAGYWEANQVELAKITADEALRLLVSPKGVDEFYARGLLHLQTGNNDAAIADYDKVIAVTTQYYSAYHNRGLAYYYKGDYDRARADYDKALELSPQNHIAYNNRGNVFRSKGEYDRAIADYDKAIALRPKYSSAYDNRGLAYYYKGDYDRTIADCTTAIALNPRYDIAYINRGNAYQFKADYDRAISDYDRAIGIDPQNPEARYNRGLAYYKKNDSDRAIADYSEAIRLDPQFIRAYRSRANAYAKVGEAAKAQADRDKVAELEKRGVK
jgi:tetratricopeptide (TPR) repeat protein